MPQDYQQMICELRDAGWPQPMTPAELDERLRAAQPMVARLHSCRPSSIAASDIKEGPPQLSEAALNASARIRDVLSILTDGIFPVLAANLNEITSRIKNLESER